MKPVNLLPEQHRPRGPSGVQEGAGYGLLGILGGLLVAVLLYVLTVNQINGAQDDLVRLANEKRAADRQAAALTQFENFAQIKQTRVQSVKDLAGKRFDWERLVREMARVLPEGVYLTDLDASATPRRDAAAGTTAQASAQGASAGAPSLKLIGCAEAQPAVAVLLVRLRRLHLTEDVELIESVKGDGGGAGSGQSAPEGSGPAACDRYKFEVSVELSSPPAGQAAGRGHAPASLGGGS